MTTIQSLAKPCLPAIKTKRRLQTLSYSGYEWQCLKFQSFVVNSLCLQAIASDADSGVLGQLSYSIVAGNDNQRFVINSTTADIMNAVKLDREVQESYTLTVQAIDSGPNKR